MRPLRSTPFVCAALLVLAGCSAQSDDRQQSRDSDLPPAAELTGPTVTLDGAELTGVVDGGVRTFSGLRYAQPPVDDLRWAPPEPAEDLSGAIDATRPGSEGAQSSTIPGAPSSAEEDCLFLNVTTPSTEPNGPRPVLVSWHGGGYISGAGSQYDARRLAEQGDVIVVTVNYRLGIFGYLGLPGLAGSGNFGFADQLESLRWVRDNIAAFGGDANNLTLAGESGGGFSACAALTSPAAADLLDKAIIQSGSCLLDWPAGGFYPSSSARTPYAPLVESEAQGSATAAELGCSGPDVVGCLRALPAEALLPVAGRDTALAYGTDLLPQDPAEALRDGDVLPVPILTGGNHDEATLTIGGVVAAIPDLVTDATYPDLLRTAFGDDADAVEAEYPREDYPSALQTLTTVMTDRAWACPTLTGHELAARESSVYAYEFNDPGAPNVLGVDVPRLDLAASHASELAYLFDLAGRPADFTAEQQTLADQMVSYWTAFAGSGDPNDDGFPRWQPFSEDETVLSLGPGPEGIAPADVGAEHHCGFWADLG